MSKPQTDWNAAAYDRLSTPHERWGKDVLERLELRGTETVLDAGCGSGRVTEALLGRLGQGRVVAVDASPAMLAVAQQRLARFGPRVRFLRTDLLALGPRQLGGEAPLDAVFSTATFHWITDHQLLFANLASVLKAGGQLVAQCGGAGNIESVLRALRRLGLERKGVWHYATVEQTERRLAAAGFTEIKVWTYPEPTPFGNLETLAEFLETVCLREHIGSLPAGERRTVARRVAQELEQPLIDYVRLNIVARRG